MVNNKEKAETDRKEWASNAEWNIEALQEREGKRLNTSEERNGSWPREGQLKSQQLHPNNLW